MTRARTRLAGALLVVVLGSGVLTGCIPPLITTFVVSSTLDVVDAHPGDGVCETSTPGQCTLRAAIQEANASPAATEVVVQLAAGQDHLLTLAGADDAAASGDLDVHGRVTIEGNGSRIVNGVDPFVFMTRLIEHHEGRLVLEDLVLRGGGSKGRSVVGSPIDGMDGGALLNRAQLELEDVEISGAGTDGQGAALHQVAGSTLLRRVTVTGNDALGSVISLVTGDFVMVDSAVTGNPSEASPVSGHYTAIRQFGGTAVILSSTISANTITQYVCDHWICGVATNTAHGIDADGSVTIARSTIGPFGPWASTFDLEGSGSFVLSGSIVGNCDVAAASAGYNHVAEPGCLSSALASDTVSTEAVLGAIGLNGGTTPNRVPLPGSAIVDVIPAGTAGLCDGSFLADQRGAPQPVGGACDVGSVERQPTDP